MSTEESVLEEGTALAKFHREDLDTLQEGEILSGEGYQVT